MNPGNDDFLHQDSPEENIPSEEQITEAQNGVSYLQQELLKRMKGIASDLWQGSGAGTVPGGSGKTEAPAARPQNKPVPKAAITEGKKDIHSLWKSADATVDWTDALIHDRPSDGLTSMKLWDLYHRMAPKVLDGDLDAYAEVLTTTNPLGELTDYVNGMVIRTPDPDRLECRFECRKVYMEKEPELYLSGLSLRIARDLLAALPVSEIYVEGNQEGQRRIGVTYTRAALQKKNPVFLNPVEFVKECGGVIYT